VLRPDSSNRRDIVTDSAIALIIEGGVPAVTFGALGRLVGLTPQAIHLWVGTRARLVEWITATFAQRWSQWTEGRSYEHAALALLPMTEEELGWTRVLLALEEQVRIQPELAPILAGMRQDERDLLGRVYPELAVRADGADQDGPDLADQLLLLIDGLRAAMCRPETACPPRCARAILQSECGRMGGPPATWLASYAPLPLPPT
jgi:AcrR family transcriptional regulator